VTEAQAAGGETFGAARLLATLDGARDRSTTALIEATTAAVERFAGDAPQSDDITLLALRFRGPPGA
jgi:sigma-B regulation protein RsbU (phosphoserine phosphatase)